MGEQPAARGSFSIGITNDEAHVFVTVGIPRVIDVPYVGPTSLKALGVTAAAIFVPWMWWYGRRTVRRWRKYIDDKREERAEAERKAESPARATKWESKSHKLDDFMNEQIAPARQRLRKVDDPDTVAKRIAKRERIKEEQAKKPKGKLGLSDGLLQNTRGSLRQVTEAPAKEAPREKPGFSDVLQKSRSGLRRQGKGGEDRSSEDNVETQQDGATENIIESKAANDTSLEEDNKEEHRVTANGTGERGDGDSKCAIS